MKLTTHLHVLPSLRIGTAIISLPLYVVSQQWRIEGGLVGSNPPEILKALQNRAKINPIVKTVKKIAEFRTSTPQDVRKKDIKILKLRRFAIVLH